MYLRLPADRPGTFSELLEGWARPHGERVLLPRRCPRRHEPLSYTAMLKEVDRLAAGLAAQGIRRHDRVGLLAENRWEWLMCDLAMVSQGIVDVPRGSDTAPEEMKFILKHAGAIATFCADAKTAEAILALKDQLPELQQVFLMEDESTLDGVMGLNQLRAAGDAWIAENPEGLAELRSAVTPDDLLTIVYTSGTTAEPKGVMLTHRNVISNLRNIAERLDVSHADVFLSVLPAWHMYERILDYLVIACGGQLVYTDRRRIKEDLKHVQPTVFAAVPRIWESIHDGIESAAHKAGGMKGRLARRSLAAARSVGAGKAGLGDRLWHMVGSAAVFPKVRNVTGGRMRMMVSGGGALPKHVDELLLGVGLPILNGYGLTETSPVTSIRSPKTNRPYTIGAPLLETEVQLRDLEGNVIDQSESGVIWIRGPQVMQGYYKNQERTQQVLDPEGWFNSGDLGCIDKQGMLHITGRAKDTIVLAGGENVEPEPLELAIKNSPYIEQAVVVGQDQKNLGALLVPNLETLEHDFPRDQWEEEGHVVRGKSVQALMRKELDRLLTRENGFRPVDRVATFRIWSEPFTPENGMLTQTLKVKRHVLATRMGDLIHEMFD